MIVTDDSAVLHLYILRYKNLISVVLLIFPSLLCVNFDFLLKFKGERSSEVIYLLVDFVISGDSPASGLNFVYV